MFLAIDKGLDVWQQVSELQRLAKVAFLRSTPQATD